VLNDGAFSWRSSRQGEVTLSSSEGEFVAVSQADQEVVYLREFLPPTLQTNTPMLCVMIPVYISVAAASYME
jgi:hypothetical protein